MLIQTYELMNRNKGLKNTAFEVMQSSDVNFCRLYVTQCQMEYSIILYPKCYQQYIMQNPQNSDSDWFLKIKNKKSQYKIKFKKKKHFILIDFDFCLLLIIISHYILGTVKQISNKNHLPVKLKYTMFLTISLNCQEDLQ